MVLGQDASYSFESFKERYNSDLANDYGNLVNRIFILIKKYFNKKIPKPGNYNKIDLEIISSTKKLTVIINKNFNQLKIHDGIENTLNILRSINKYLELKKPWVSVKESNQPKSESATTLYVAAEVLRIASCHLYPIMPNKTIKIISAMDKFQNDKYNHDTSFGIITPNTKINIINNIFPRIE